MRPVLERSKLCLDHACTLYGFHASFCAFMIGLRAVMSISAIFTLFLCCLIATQVGRFYCSQLELLPIPIGIPTVTNTTTIGTARLRACLPVLTGCIARILNLFKRRDAPPTESIPLNRLQVVTVSDKNNKGPC